MFVLKTWIYSNKTDTLENNLSITEFSFVYVPFHPEEILTECGNLSADEPSWAEEHNTHTYAPATSPR